MLPISPFQTNHQVPTKRTDGEGKNGSRRFPMEVRAMVPSGLIMMRRAMEVTKIAQRQGNFENFGGWEGEIWLCVV